MPPHLSREGGIVQRCRRGSCGKDVHCGMKSEHLVGTSIPRFTYDTPAVPGNGFYALCEGEHPLCMIFLPGFDHPVSREYITRYLKTLPQLYFSFVTGERILWQKRSRTRTPKRNISPI